MRPPSIPSLFVSSSPSGPPADLHSKVQAESPQRDKINTMNACLRTFSASKTLQQVLSFREPEPFIPPPAIPNGLMTRFEARMQMYEQLGIGQAFAPELVEDFSTSQQGKPNLADIMEEKESPVRSTAAHAAIDRVGGRLRINVPKWTSDKHAVAVAQRCTFLDSDSDAANDATSEHTDYDTDDEKHVSWKYGSSTTLAVSDHSGPESAGSDEETSAASSFPPRTSSLFPPGHYRDDGIGPYSGHRSDRVFGMRCSSAQSLAVGDSHSTNTDVDAYAQKQYSSLRRAESLPVLFPSPSVNQHHGYLPQPTQVIAGSGVNTRHALSDANLDHDKGLMMSATPQITVQAPSPVKAPTSRKRAPSSSNYNDFGPPLPQRVRRDDFAGLPVLSVDEEAALKADIPGYTHALLIILLTWSHTMWTFHNRLPDPKLFSTHPVFPYPITPPLRRQLLSVSFYDTTSNPHKEIRFLGPGDAAEISYHEVDVFGDTDSRPTIQLRHQNRSHGASTGEGRWCYILIQGKQPEDGETPPHIILAWRISGVTETSDCLHTVYPDDRTPTLAAPEQSQPRARSKIKRLASLQNVGHALRGEMSVLRQTLRSASSSSQLQALDVGLDVERQGGATLLRKVVIMGKAGGVPLVEGFRVDAGAFRGWMEACGRGEGKVIMWRERDAKFPSFR